MDKEFKEEVVVPVLKSYLEALIYGSGYIVGCSTLRKLLNLRNIRGLETTLGQKLSEIGISNFDFDLVRYQLGDVFAAALYAKVAESSITGIGAFLGRELPEKQGRILASSIIITALTAVEAYQATLPNRSFDFQDMAAYLLGLFIYMNAKPICERFVEWYKSPQPPKSLVDSRAL